jgi:hypothetical protein
VRGDGEQRLFGQCTALVIGGKSRTCESITLGHNIDGRSYFEIPSSAGTVLIGGDRAVNGPRLTLKIDSLDPGTGEGETAFGTCQMQMNPGLDTLAGLTCTGAGGQTGQFMFVFKPTAQKVDGRLPLR